MIIILHCHSSVEPDIFKSGLSAMFDFARKDVDLSINAPTELLLGKHAAYIQAYEKKTESYEYVVAEHLRMNGVYWCLTAVDLMGRLESMNNAQIIDFVRMSQHECGGFCASQVSDGHDPHLLHTLSAVQSRLDAIDTLRTARYVLRCQNFDGGFGTRPGSESHAGQVYCCVGTLAILGQLERVDSDRLGWWLAERQCTSGGLNGRPEKMPDVCYSWWVLASLSIIDRLHWVDKDEETGGIADRPGDMSDPFHTIFGLAGLSLLNSAPDLKAVNPVFCMPQQCLDRARITIGRQKTRMQ